MTDPVRYREYEETLANINTYKRAKLLFYASDLNSLGYYTNGLAYNYFNTFDSSLDQISPAVSSLLLADGGTIGLDSSSKARIEFNDDSPDVIKFLDSSAEIENGDLTVSKLGGYCLGAFSTYHDGATAPLLTLIKSDSDVLGTLAETATGRILGQYGISGVNSSSAAANGAVIYGTQNGAAGATYVPTDLTLATYSDTALNASQVVLHRDGNVGIGWSIPDTKLHVSTGDATGTGRGIATFENNGDAEITLLSPSANNCIINFGHGTGATVLSGRLDFDCNTDIMAIRTLDNAQTSETNLFIDGRNFAFTHDVVVTSNVTSVSHLVCSLVAGGGSTTTDRWGIVLDNFGGGGAVTNSYFAKVGSDFYATGAPTGTTTQYLKIDIGGALYKIAALSEA